MRLFTDVSDPLLLAHMHNLLLIAVPMLLVDGLQINLQGFLQVGV